MSDEIGVGVLFAQTGNMAVTEQALLSGTLVAIDEINSGGGVAGRPIVPIIEDPGPDPASYRDIARRMVLHHQVPVIFGCCSSASRKAVLPVVERHGAVLFYPSVYEGFEYSPNVIYTGPTPAQTIVPLIKYLFAHHGRRFFLVGSEYVFAREISRIAKEFLLESAGSVAGEIYLPMGAPESAFAEVAERIAAARPDVVLSTVVGADTARLYAACHAIGATSAGHPIASLTASEAEIAALSPAARAGHLTVAPYFAGIESPASARFTTLYEKRYGAGRRPNMYAEAGYLQVHLFARAVPREGAPDPDRIVRSLGGTRHASAQGEVEIDADTNHTALKARIGRSREDGGFDLLWEDASIVRPDPYLVAYERKIL